MQNVPGMHVLVERLIDQLLWLVASQLCYPATKTKSHTKKNNKSKKTLTLCFQRHNPTITRRSRPAIQNTKINKTTSHQQICVVLRRMTPCGRACLVEKNKTTGTFQRFATLRRDKLRCTRHSSTLQYIISTKSTRILNSPRVQKHQRQATDRPKHKHIRMQPNICDRR